MPVEDPVGPVAFDRLMRTLGPFESAPHIAVGVSGGADSMALALLLRQWLAARGGRLLALTVDHGLRAESAGEAARVAGWMAGHGIAHRLLSWSGPKPSAGIQHAARQARLRLLAEAAAAAGCLHLALAHHADDQAETYRLRVERGSGAAGLAGMPAIRELPRLRLIRPLLPVAKARLTATCRALGQDWLEDPSNRNPAFARARLRLLRAAGPADADAARAAGRHRAAADDRAADMLAATVRFLPEGWAMIDRSLPGRAGDDLVPLLATLLRAVGGAVYAPPPAAVTSLAAEMRQGPGGGRTLGGCRLVPVPDGWHLVREARNLPAPLALTGGGPPIHWDGRFSLSVEVFERFTVQPLTDALWRQALADRPGMAAMAPPAMVRASLPAILTGDRLRAIPHMAYRTTGMVDPRVRVVPLVLVEGVPARFAVVTAVDDII
ncbi:tRNA lysidine(34) synthetase TilS [Niveispirillum fermenti]|uniref:tRNA lysidine(34) synthetase TilS n=1 Tax=Niveispirillum fermenti TaxID=1233113 RepID=UPI003A8C354F